MAVQTGAVSPDKFTPLTVQEVARPPRARLSEDRSLGWLRRSLPLVWAHKLTFGFALGLSAAALALQTSLPKIAQLTIDDAITTHAVPLVRMVVLLVGV